MRAKTLRTYAYWITRFKDFCGGVLTEECFENKAYEFIEYLKRENYSPSTIRIAYAAINMLAEGRGVNLRLTNLPPVEEKIPPFLEEEEIKKLIDGTPSLRDKAIIALLYDCALRVGELIELDVEDVNLKDRTILVKSRKWGGFPQRLPMSEKTAEILEKYIKERGLESGALFPSSLSRGFGPRPSRSGRITNAGVYYIVRSWGELVLGKKVHPQMLRHTAAVMLLKHGVDMETIRDFLGLKSDTTTRQYARLMPAELKKLPPRL